MNWYGILNYIKYLFLEKPRGLDFSKPDTSFVKGDSLENYYSRTDHSTLKQVNDYLNLCTKDSFLDIGSGKGMVLYYFAKRNSGKICGIEKFDELANISKKNMQLLKIDDRVEIVTMDAMEFDRYDEFNYFFVFNPFKYEVAQAVIKKIMDSWQNNHREIRVVSVQAFFNEYFIRAGFVQEHVVKSKLTGVGAYIFYYNGSVR